MGNDSANPVDPKLTPAMQKALSANAFVLEVNTMLEKFRQFCIAEKVPPGVACAAMLIFCRNFSNEGSPMRNSLETILRKNFPFMKLQSPPAKADRQ